MVCLDSVSVYPKTITLQVGKGTYAAYAVVSPRNADRKEVTWHSDNPIVASVNEYDAYIYANAEGTARIYATATDGSNCSDFTTVYVRRTVSVESASLNQTGMASEKGQSLAFATTACPEDATDQMFCWRTTN